MEFQRWNGPRKVLSFSLWWGKVHEKGGVGGMPLTRSSSPYAAQRELGRNSGGASDAVNLVCIISTIPGALVAFFSCVTVDHRRGKSKIKVTTRPLTRVSLWPRRMHVLLEHLCPGKSLGRYNPLIATHLIGQKLVIM